MNNFSINFSFTSTSVEISFFHQLAFFFTYNFLAVALLVVAVLRIRKIRRDVKARKEARQYDDILVQEYKEMSGHGSHCDPFSCSHNLATEAYLPHPYDSKCSCATCLDTF